MRSRIAPLGHTMPAGRVGSEASKSLSVERHDPVDGIEIRGPTPPFDGRLNV